MGKKKQFPLLIGVPQCPKITKEKQGFKINKK